MAEGDKGATGKNDEGTSKAGEVQDVMIEAAQVQMASVNAGIAFWREWVDTASKFVAETNRRLVRLAEERDAESAVLEMTDATRAYVREMGKLPEVAAKAFAKEMEQVGGAGPRKRSAKAKE